MRSRGRKGTWFIDWVGLLCERELYHFHVFGVHGLVRLHTRRVSQLLVVIQSVPTGTPDLVFVSWLIVVSESASSLTTSSQYYVPCRSLSLKMGMSIRDC